MLTSREITQAAVFIALLSVSAHLKIQIGLVPITFQMMMVILAGLLLNHKQILFVMLGYIFLGLVGLPVFASGAGLTYILSPSFGFIIGFVALALIINWSKNKLIGIGIGYLVLYFFGLTYLLIILRTVHQNPIPINALFTGYWVVFLPSDLLSIVLAWLIHKRLKGVISHS